MKTFKLQTYIVILILVMISTACGSPAAPLPQPSATPEANPPAQPSASPSPSANPTIDLQPCSLGSTRALCGTLRVYEDRAARSGRMIDLRVAVIKAQSPNPAPDPIFYLAGGPGGAATEDAAREQQFPYSLGNNHDLVFVDQRGTGGSNRVVIPPSPDLSGLPQAEAEQQAKAWVADFLAGIDMDPRFYTTSVAMDDLDEVREALGYDQINLVGYSYGATAAQYYLMQHEEHVRSVFLGSGSLLDIPVFERWAANGQQALDRIFDLCQADSACQAAYPNLREEFSALMARLATDPVTITFSNKSLGNATLTPDYLAPVIRLMTKNAKNDPALPRLIHRAYAENDWEGFRQFIEENGNYEWWSDQLMEHVIRCGEKWAAFDPAEVARLSEGSYLKGFDMWLAQAQAVSCQYTPLGFMPEGTSPQPGSQVPVLIVNGDLDPIDPPENMEGAQTLFPNSTILAWPYQGHSWSDYTAVKCMWSIQDEFIQTGSAQGLHTECLQQIQPLTFYTVN
jgi:pimeloyl-ACP methyl ester carboxylesterase